MSAEELAKLLSISFSELISTVASIFIPDNSFDVEQPINTKKIKNDIFFINSF